MSITQKLVNFSLEKSFRDLPSSVVHDTKRIVLDGIGCAIGGFSMKNCSGMITDVTKTLGGPKESTIIGDWSKVSCVGGTYANAKLGTLMDMDDVFFNIGHQSPMVLYPALSIGEKEKSSGKDFLAAVAVGFDIASRVVLGIGTLFDVIENRVEQTDVTGFGQGIFGGAVSAGKLLKLDVAQMISALGIAGLSTPAPLCIKAALDLNMSKFHFEWSALGAIFAALLAKKGYLGPETILDDDFYAKGLGKKTFLKDIICVDLGDRWYISETSIKPYPACRHNHYALDLVSKIVKEHNIKPEKISKIIVRGLGSYRQPPWNNYEPKNQFELQFSVPFTVALSALQIKPGPKWMDGDLLKNETLKNLARKVVLEVNPGIAQKIKETLPLPTVDIPTTVEIRAGGRKYTAETRYAKGDGFSREKRMTDEEVMEKFKENTSGVLQGKKMERMIEKVLALDKLKDVGEVFSFKSIKQRS